MDKSCLGSCLTDVNFAAGSPMFMPHAWPPHSPEEDAYRGSPVPRFRGGSIACQLRLTVVLHP